MATSRAFWSAQLHALCFALGQRLFCAGADEVALDLCGKAQHRGHNLGLHGAIEHDAVFDHVQVDALVHALAHDFENLQRRSGQPGHLRHYEHVGGVRLLDHVAQRALTPVGFPAGRVVNKKRRVKAAGCAVIHNAVALVRHVLGVSRYTEIGENLRHGVQIVRPFKINAIYGFNRARSAQLKPGAEAPGKRTIDLIAYGVNLSAATTKAMPARTTPASFHV